MQDETEGPALSIKAHS